MTLPEAIGVCNVIISLYREASSFIIHVSSGGAGISSSGGAGISSSGGAGISSDCAGLSSDGAGITSRGYWNYFWWNF